MASSTAINLFETLAALGRAVTWDRCFAMQRRVRRRNPRRLPLGTSLSSRAYAGRAAESIRWHRGSDARQLVQAVSWHADSERTEADIRGLLRPSNPPSRATGLQARRKNLPSLQSARGSAAEACPRPRKRTLDYRLQLESPITMSGAGRRFRLSKSGPWCCGSQSRWPSETRFTLAASGDFCFK